MPATLFEWLGEIFLYIALIAVGRKFSMLVASLFKYDCGPYSIETMRLLDCLVCFFVLIERYFG